MKPTIPQKLEEICREETMRSRYNFRGGRKTPEQYSG
jgi:hypothetical protein